MKKLLLFMMILPLLGISQSRDIKKSNDKPKLVVGVVVDQMRFDYLYRYWDKYGNGGFKKLLAQGFSCSNTHFNYIPTYTGPGHTSIFTGTTPTIHGVIANDWYNKSTKKIIYCAYDSTRMSVGSDSDEGKMSPHQMLVPTISDQMRLSSNFKSKSIGISLKDRGAIFPAGHSANAAYWLDGSTGNWISSSYYMNKLPDWVLEENKKRAVDSYLSKSWNTLLPIEQYIESYSDNNEFEEPFKTELNPIFPHNLMNLKNENGSYGMIKSTPFGNTLTKEMAIAAIKGERLGKTATTDFISISFSSTDYIGHRFGPQSIEVEDTYLRLDKDLEELISFLDSEIGKENYLFFLTADHGASYTPAYLINQKLAGGYFDEEEFVRNISEELNKKFGKGDWIENFSNEQIFLNHQQIENKNNKIKLVKEFIVNYSINKAEIANAITAEDLMIGNFSTNFLKLAQEGYNQKRSGDIIFVLTPGYINHKKTGTTHGSPFNYDTHVPLLWYGKGIEKGETSTPVSITDIAPTIATLLKLQMPDGVTGKPIKYILPKSK